MKKEKYPVLLFATMRENRDQTAFPDVQTYDTIRKQCDIIVVNKETQKNLTHFSHIWVTYKKHIKGIF